MYMYFLLLFVGLMLVVIAETVKSYSNPLGVIDCSASCYFWLLCCKTLGLGIIGLQLAIAEGTREGYYVSRCLLESSDLSSV